MSTHCCPWTHLRVGRGEQTGPHVRRTSSPPRALPLPPNREVLEGPPGQRAQPGVLESGPRRCGWRRPPAAAGEGLAQRPEHPAQSTLCPPRPQVTFGGHPGSSGTLPTEVREQEGRLLCLGAGCSLSVSGALGPAWSCGRRTSDGNIPAHFARTATPCPTDLGGGLPEYPGLQCGSSPPQARVGTLLCAGTQEGRGQHLAPELEQEAPTPWSCPGGTWLRFGGQWETGLGGQAEAGLGTWRGLLGAGRSSLTSQQ